MSETDTVVDPAAEQTVADSWRGVQAEDDDVTTTGNLVLASRSRRLLWSLVRPYRRQALVALTLIVVENALEVSGPLLIKYGLDTGVGQARHRDWLPLILAVVGYAVVALLGSLTLYQFLRVSGRLSQSVLFDLRVRLFRHMQRLSVSFHESYTSGKVIARLTGDIETLQELLEGALNEAFGAILSVVSIAALLIWLDPTLALVVLAGFVPLFYLTRWSQRRQRSSYRRTRGVIAKVVVQFVESMGSGSLTQVLNTTVTPPLDPSPEARFASPFAATAELLAAIARPPRTEIPGIEIREPAQFDVTPDPEHTASGGVHIGSVLDSADRPVDEFAVSTDTLNRHTFVAGATGSGKSQSVRHLLEGLHRKGIPWLVIEPAKAEYAGMAGRISPGGIVTVIRPGQPEDIPVGLNPLEPEAGFPLQTHIDLTRALFEAAFDAAEPFPQVLAHALTRCYTDIGWDTALGESRLQGGVIPKYPSLADLQTTALEVVAGIGYGREITDNVKGFIDVRIGSLRLGAPGRFFEGGYRLDVADLLERNVVLEIEDVGNDTDKAFFIGAVLIRIYEHVRVRHTQRQAGWGLRHITVIEEAHRLLKNAERGTPAAHAVELFAGLLAEIRAYGEGFVVAEQIPSKITPDVIKNTALKIVHRLPAKEDRDALGATMNLTAAQSRHVVSLPPGRAAIFTDGMDRPMRLHVPLSEHNESRDNRQTDLRLANWNELEPAPLTLKDLAAAQRLAEDHQLTLWIELIIVAHIIGGPSPHPHDEWITQLLTERGRDLTTAAIIHRIRVGINSRYRGLAHSYQPESLAQHLIQTALSCLDGERPCQRTRAKAPVEETRWQAGPYRWADVFKSLRDAVRAGQDDQTPHPDTDDWRNRSLHLPGDSCAEQLAALRVRQDVRADPGSGHDTLVTGSGTPPIYVPATLRLSYIPDPLSRFAAACAHLRFTETNLRWLTNRLEVKEHLSGDS